MKNLPATQAAEASSAEASYAGKGMYAYASFIGQYAL